LVLKEKEEMKKQENILRRDIIAIETLRSQVPQADCVASDVLLASEISKDKRNELDKHARELVTLSMAFVEKKKNYMRLIRRLLFLGVYSLMLILQKNGTVVYDIESRLRLN
jgi:alkylhydroperoxidase/carboxymuconolactone decarboxylase family protein YurZ